MWWTVSGNCFNRSTHTPSSLRSGPRNARLKDSDPQEFQDPVLRLLDPEIARVPSIAVALGAVPL